MTHNDPIRSLLIVSGAIIVIAVLAVGLVLLIEDEESEFPEGSPERIFQEYLHAYRDRDFERSYSYFSDTVQVEVPIEVYVREARSNQFFDDESRVSIDDVDIDGDSATLVVIVESSFGQGLERDSYTEERIVPLVRSGGEWRIDIVMLDVNPSPWLVERSVVVDVPAGIEVAR